MKQNPINKEKSVFATVIISIVIIALFLFSYYQAGNVIEERSILRMEEGVSTVVDEIVGKLNRDSSVLNAAADIISSADLYDEKAVLEMMATIAPLLETMDIFILLPDNRVLRAQGSIVDAAGALDFGTEAPLGEHVSNRVVSLADENVFLLRHFVPIMQDGQVAALLYGSTRLSELPKIMNIEHIYNASADVYMIDAANGEYLMDTAHETLGVVGDFDHWEVRGDGTWEDVKNAVMNQESGYAIRRSPERGNEWQYLYYVPSGINQWMIAVSVPEREALDELYAIQRVFYFAGALMVAAIVAYYYWTRRNAKKVLDAAVQRAVLEEKLHKAEAAEKAKTIFLSNMSHDIRTPMNAIIGFATLAKTNIDNRERIEEYMEKILSSGNYLLSLINDVLDMSRIESGKLNIDEKPCSISDIFRDMRNIVQTQMQSKQLAFFMDTMNVVDEDIICDKVHVNQVLLNLLSNAIKFTPAGGSVSLIISQMPNAPAGYGSYEIRVKDTGIGMSPDFIQHIFEPFERERNSTVSGIQGTGLGMAIAKSIVDAMGGTICVESEVGHGTEFIIHLQLRLQAERGQVEVSAALDGKRALVVDDNFSTCDSVTKMLAQIGMHAVWTMHGQEAVLRARQAMEMGEDFFAYIIDWVLPDLNGLEVARQIRSIVGDDALIVVMTAYDWSAIEDEAREAGVTEFCNKPIFLSELREILEHAVRKPITGEDISLPPQVGKSLNGKRLLVVEDNELNREIAEELLTESGLLVECAEDGTVAVEKVKAADSGYYDLVLMDVQMPVMNGYDATKAIRALDDPEKASIPIVAMTANAFEEDRRRATEAGMNAYASKPINIDELLEILGKVLNAE